MMRREIMTVVGWSYKENPRCSTNATGEARGSGKGTRGDAERCQISPGGETPRGKSHCPFL